MRIWPFESKEMKQKKACIKLLAGVMVADGRIDPKEMVLLHTIGCGKMGLGEKAIAKILKSPKGAKFSPPADMPSRLSLLVDMVMMMLIDGQIDVKEAGLCETVAVALGFRREIIPKLVHDIVTRLQSGRQQQQVNAEVAAWLAQ